MKEPKIGDLIAYTGDDDFYGLILSVTDLTSEYEPIAIFWFPLDEIAYYGLEEYQDIECFESFN